MCKREEENKPPRWSTRRHCHGEASRLHAKSPPITACVRTGEGSWRPAASSSSFARMARFNACGYWSPRKKPLRSSADGLPNESEYPQIGTKEEQKAQNILCL